MRVCSRDSSAQDVTKCAYVLTALTSFIPALKFSCSYSTEFRVCNIESHAAFLFVFKVQIHSVKMAEKISRRICKNRHIFIHVSATRGLAQSLSYKFSVYTYLLVVGILKIRFLGCYAVQNGKQLPTVSEEPTATTITFMLNGLFDLANGGTTHLRNVSNRSSANMT